MAAVKAGDVRDIGTMDPGQVAGIEAGDRYTRTMISIWESKTWSNQSARVKRKDVESLLDSWARYVGEIRGRGAEARLFPDTVAFLTDAVRVGGASS